MDLAAFRRDSSLVIHTFNSPRSGETSRARDKEEFAANPAVASPATFRK
jgi:hypothetical protein